MANAKLLQWTVTAQPALLTSLRSKSMAGYECTTFILLLLSLLLFISMIVSKTANLLSSVVWLLVLRARNMDWPRISFGNQQLKVHKPLSDWSCVGNYALLKTARQWQHCTIPLIHPLIKRSCILLSSLSFMTQNELRHDKWVEKQTVLLYIDYYTTNIWAAALQGNEL